MKKEKTKNPIEVVKKEEPIIGKPSAEEVQQYKQDFDNALEKFHTTRWAISNVGSFPANEVGMFLIDYMKNYGLWTKTGWMGMLKMKVELDEALKMNNEATGLTLDYNALEFCGYMLMNPGGIGYDNAAKFEAIADKYSTIMIEVGQKIDEAREELKRIQYLQEKWAAGEQGFYLEEPKSEQSGEEVKEEIKEEIKEEPLVDILKTI